MKTGKKIFPIENYLTSSPKESSSLTVKELYNKLRMEAVETNSDTLVYIKVSPTGEDIFLKTHDKEDLQNLVKEKDSERRVRETREKKEKQVFKVVFWKEIIDSISSGVKKLFRP